MSPTYAPPGQLWLLPQSQQEGLDVDHAKVIEVSSRPTARCAKEARGTRSRRSSTAPPTAP